MTNSQDTVIWNRLIKDMLTEIGNPVDPKRHHRQDQKSKGLPTLNSLDTVKLTISAV